MELEKWRELGSHIKKARRHLQRARELDCRSKTQSQDWLIILNRLEKLRSKLDDIATRDLADTGLDYNEITKIFYGPDTNP